MYAPVGNPQYPKVCPKSSLCLSKPTPVATSKIPAIPKVELIKNLNVSSIANLNFPCKS